MSRKPEQQSLFEELENNDWESEWKGMPEFSQQDLKPSKRLIVNFETKEDYIKFVRLLKLQTAVTDKTKSIWFPIQEKQPPKDFGYVLFDEKESNES